MMKLNRMSTAIALAMAVGASTASQFPDWIGPARKQKQPNPERQAAAEAKRQRRAERNRKQERNQ